jgi:tetratricopeptide (TPR) repeat protein
VSFLVRYRLWFARCAFAAAMLAATPPDSAAQSGGIEAAARLVEERRFAEAKPLLVELTRREPRNARAVQLAGRTHVELNEPDAAVRQLERAVQLEPDSAAHHFWLGRAYALQLANTSALRARPLAGRVRSSFERAIALDPGHAGARFHLIQFHIRAPAMVGGDRALALEHARQFAARDPYAGAIILAGVHEMLGDTAAAELVMVAAAAKHPDSLTLQYAVVTQRQDRGRFDEADAVLAPLLERSPRPAMVLYLIGRGSAVSGRDPDRGEQALREYLQRTPAPNEPTHAAAHTRIGDILRHRGDTAGARRAWEQALRLDPEFEEARARLRALR